MAMTGTGMATAVEQAMNLTAANDPTGAGRANILLMCNAIVQYIQANAVVSTTDTVSVTASVVATVIAPPSGGPCTGTLASSGSGTGTGTVA